jgi:hypothetical protein
MFSFLHPKYKFKEDFTVKLCNNYDSFYESFKNKIPCKNYENLVFKKGNVFEANKNVDNQNQNIIFGQAKNIPFEVPLSVLEKVDDSTPITDIIQGDPEVNKAKKQALIDAYDKKVKIIFIAPTIIVLAVVWIYGFKKL